MKYKIDFLQIGKTSTGKEKADATLVDEIGTHTDVTIWGDFTNFANLMVGQEVEGDIVPSKDGKYKPSLSAPRAPKTASSGAYKQKLIEDTMIKKEASITRFQGQKEESIKLMSAERDAVLIVTTFYKERLNSDPIIGETEMESILKKKIVEWRDWFLNDKQFTDTLPF